MPAGDRIFGLGRVGTDTVLELDVTAVVTGDGTHTFVLTTTNSDSVSYASRESAHPPELILTLE